MAPYGELDCNKCKKTLPVSYFYRESSIVRGYRYACKKCEAPRFNNYRNTPGVKKRIAENKRRWNRARMYNFPPELYDQRLAEQGNVCAICGTNTPGGRGEFHADHNHETNPPRGVLCHNCNVALGNFQDNPEILQSAIDYLNKYSEVK